MAPGDFYLFLQHKSDLGGHRIGSDEKGMKHINSWIQNQTLQFFANRMKNWVPKLCKVRGKRRCFNHFSFKFPFAESITDALK